MPNRRSEDAANQLHHNAAMQAAGVGGWIWHVDAMHFEIDAQIEKLFGFEPGGYDGSFDTFLSLVEPDDRDMVSTKVASLLETRQGFEVTYRSPSQNGQVRWIKTRGEPIAYDDQGNIIRAAGATWEVTAETLLQIEKNAALAQMREVSRLSGIGFWQLDAATSKIKFDSAWLHNVGVPPDAIVTVAYLLEHLVPTDATGFQRDLQVTLDNSTPLDTVFGWQRPDNGEVMTVRARGNAQTDAQGNVTGIDGVAIDETQIHLAQQESQRLLARAQAVEDLGEVGFWEYYPQEGSLDFSPKWKKLIGLPSAGVSPVSTIIEHTHPNDRDGWPQAIENTLHTGKPLQQSFGWYHTDTHELLHLRIIGAPVHDPAGRITGVTGVVLNETETLRLQREKEANQQKIDQILDTGQLGFWSMDAATDAFTFDHGWAHMVGRDPNWQAPNTREMLKRVAHPDDAKPLYQALKNTLASGEPLSGEFRYVHAQTGEVRRGQVQANAVRDAGQRITGLVGFVIDREDEIKARQATEVALQRVDEAAAAASLGFWSIDAASGALDLDDNWRRLVGWDLQAPMPSLEQALQLLVDEDNDAFRQHLNALLEQGKALDYEYRIHRADNGHIRNFHIRGQAHRDATGQIERYSGYISDQTEAVARRRELEDLRRSYDHAMQSGGIGSLSIDLRTQTARIDKNLAKLLQIPVEEFGGTVAALIDTIIPEDQPTLLHAIERGIATGEEQAFRHRRRLPNGDIRWLKTRGAVHFSTTGAPLEINGATIDITDMVELTLALERSNTDLEDFAHIASHDLREPLRGIHQMVTYLGKDYGELLDEKGQYMLNTTAELAERLDKLLEELLYYSRLGRAELAMQPTDLDEVVNGVLRTLQFNLDEKHIEIERPERLPTVICDRVRAGELFRNLITNAMKYNDKDAPKIAIGYANNTFYVRDNGIGIAPHNQDRVFKIFKRLHARNAYGGGTGAGLTIAQQIVHRHAGRLWLESTVGEGTTFYFTLSQGARPSGS